MTRNSIPALLLWALFALPSHAQARPSAKPHPPAAPEQTADPLQEAEGLLQKGQYAQAEEKLQSQASEQAKNPQFWFDLGFAQSHQGKTREAVTAYRKAVALAPDWFEANLNLGIDLLKSGDSSAAVPVLKHAVELKPASGGQQSLARAWISLAQASEVGDPKGAAAAYDKAAELNPSDAGLIARAGGLLQKSGDLASAEAHYRKAAEAGQTAGMAQLIDLLIAQKRYADAETWLQKYTSQNPQDPAPRVQLARILAAQGKTAEAIAMLEQLNENGGSPALKRTLGELYLDNKQYGEASPLLQEVLAQNPNDAQLHMDLGIAVLHLLKYAEAESELLKAIQLKPDLVDAYYELAYAAQQNKHYQLSIRVLNARANLRPLRPETAGTYWIRAVSYDNLGAVKLAVENYKLFLAASGGKSPDQEFQARHRLKAIEPQR
jgi:Flp pilus assembly protein TadD